MVAGIPGTSISGLFYILLAFLMPVQEARHTFNGRSSVRRWMHVGLQMINAAGIIASIWATGWGLSYLIKRSQMAGYHIQMPSQVTNLISLASACCALVILAVVLLAVMGLSLVMPKRPDGAGK